MELPNVNNPVWRNLLTNQLQVDLNFLGAKMLISKLRVSLKLSPSNETVEDAIKEIYDLYQKYKDLPNAQKDILILSGK